MTSLLLLAAILVGTPDTTKSPSWDLRSPIQRLILRANQDVPLTLRVTAGRIHRPHIAFVSLQAANGETIPLGALSLCDAVVTACTAVTQLDSPATKMLRLHVVAESVGPGTYSGSVSLAVDDDTTMKSFDLTVVSKTREGWGALLVMLGIVAWLVINVFLRPWLVRDEALIPAAQLLAVLESLDRALVEAHDKAGANLPGLRKRLEKLRDRILTEVNRPTPAVFSQTQMDGFATEASVLTELIDRGVAGALRRIEPGSSVVVAAVKKALESIDRQSDDPTTADAAAAIAKAAITALDQALAPPPGAQGAQGQRTLSGPDTQVRRLERSVRRYTMGLWAFWAVITWLVGWVALVVQNDAFGTWGDLLTCFLWGLGVQAVGTSLQQLSPGNIATSLRISTTPEGAAP